MQTTCVAELTKEGGCFLYKLTWSADGKFIGDYVKPFRASLDNIKTFNDGCKILADRLTIYIETGNVDLVSSEPPAFGELTELKQKLEINSLQELIDYCKDKDRVCPQPQLWNEMWNKLKDKKQIGARWQPPLPLILAAWWEASTDLKKQRLIQHLTWADSHGQLKEIAKYLTSLTEEQWFHLHD